MLDVSTKDMGTSPKSYYSQDNKKKSGFCRHKHKNDKFYNSKVWKDTRKAYFSRYKEEIFKHIPLGEWRGDTIKDYQISYILSLPFLPCETCLRFYCAEAYDKIDPGHDLDHIKPVNRENAMDSKDHGDPLNLDNLQYLCKRHHSNKSKRERS